MAPLISCGNINLKILIPISGGVLRFVSNILLDKTNPDFPFHPIIFFILSSLSKCFGLFLYLREPSINELCDNDNIKQFKKVKCQKYVFIVLSSFFDFLEAFLSNFNYINLDIDNFLDIIFVNLFAYLILKTKFEKHHYTVIIISTILTIILSIIKLKEIKGAWKEIIIILTIISSRIFSSLNLVIDKYIIEKKSGTVYEIMFYNGVITLSLHSIYLIICTIFEISDETAIFDEIPLIEYKEKIYFDNFFEYWENINGIELVNISWFIIIEFFISLLFPKTIKYFSPNHLLLMLIIPTISSFFDGDGVDWKSYETYLAIVIYLLLIFMNLVFIEVIELNFCGLSKNTKKT